jgi:predicted ribosomally synthesized peptide with SipW-like signal peptide
MKKILLSLSVVGFATLVLAVGSTGAFFSDRENSSGNTFTAGAIDLKIDNTSYYNGVFNQDTSWSLKDLTIEKFFNFLDLKPGDRGEDTISLHINNNDAYLCANVKLTSNDDNGLTEPEALVDSTDGPGNGELASEVKFVWWADDGDNVLEDNESVISSGPIGSLGLQGSTTVALADSQNNIWTGVGGPAIGGVTQYIGKAWCFGNITPAPLPQDGFGSSSPRTPANSTGGIACDGSGLNNATQSDSLTADVTFTAVQARNNPGFLCSPPRQTAKLTVVKVVNNDNGGNNVVPDFHLFVDDGFVSTNVSSGVQATLPTGTYSVSETGVSGYVASFSGDCDSEGNVTLNPGDVKTCTITNDDLPANITLIKVVTGDGTLADPSSFRMRVDGTLVPNTTSIAVNSNSPHIITEDAKTGYHFVSITGAGCPALLGSSSPVVLNEGQAITCTITNAKN